ncbi:platelet-activating factor acetylhydrolase, isoform II-domain-containing protein [Desarmillaria tabescens]|uniref:1-alkyl-2-acetylglycerophosphocholine esterase n=1 Tax=Armillaria tabescens TaxID=1929756 RepID=A0AA39NMC5_ARMTA|nr:platelet-activating factor acetylhydrolase, isoform II-domain-containing protein [Desarmillaria tabescens]KAK0468154.1 platelet-activating factor acetylhydrolase, isoform II-domain-containing protein [Desarmillaria tabescens]
MHATDIIYLYNRHFRQSYMPFFLPDCHGLYAVGATTFVTPVRPSRIYGTAKLPNGQPALCLDEVAFTAYYPSNRDDKSWKSRRGIDWLNRPLNETWRGFVSFAQSFPAWLLWPFVFLYGAFIKVPVYHNAPLLRTKQWPLVIFSHGLGGSRTAYSQICSRIAASGRVVLAVEHRDGTAPACITREWSTDGTRTLRVVRYLQEKDVRWEQEPSSDSLYPLRRDQLMLRKHEVYLAHSVFSSLIRKDENLLLETIDGTAIDWDSWWAREDEAETVQCMENITLAGHSFGGCTIFHILSTEHPEWAAPIPVTNTLIFDPWLDPLPFPSPGRPSEDPKVICFEDAMKRKISLPRLLVINSEKFTLWKEHFERLENIVRSWGADGSLLTLVRARHESFSDFPLLPLVRDKSNLGFMNTIERLSNAFLDNQLNETLNTELTTKMGIEIVGKRKDGRPKRQIKGGLGNIVVHQVCHFAN